MKTMLKTLTVALLAAFALTITDSPLHVAQAAPPDTQYNRIDDTGQVKETGIRAKDLVRLLKAMRNQLVGLSGVAATPGGSIGVATTAAKVRTNAAVAFQINGAYYALPSTDNLCTLPATVISNLQSAYFRFELDTSGACSVTAGPVVTFVGTDKTIAPMPGRSANKVTLGLLLVQGLTFTGNTTATTADANRIYVNGDPDMIDLLEP